MDQKFLLKLRTPILRKFFLHRSEKNSLTIGRGGFNVISQKCCIAKKGGGGGSEHAKMSWWTVDSPVICAKKFLRVAPFSKQFLGFCMTAGHPYIKTVVLCCGCCSYKVNPGNLFNANVERNHPRY